MLARGVRRKRLGTDAGAAATVASAMAGKGGWIVVADLIRE
jgi:hypothetical protein